VEGQRLWFDNRLGKMQKMMEEKCGRRVEEWEGRR
jgi:hypothetical protein